MRGGQTAQIEFRLRSQPVYEVAGVVTGIAPEQRGANIEFVNRSGDPVTDTVRFNSDDASFNARLPAGTYTVRATSFNRQGRSAQAARTVGYRLGFTINPRGPLMFNWVPQADLADKLRPSYLPEGPVGNPLMTLPRYWPYQVRDALDAVRITGKDAAAYAQQNKPTEMAYYNIVCAGTDGPIQ